jgi:DNA-binding Xre family transcriptional regulator
MTAFAQNLNRLMDDRGVNATELAAACGVNKATVSRWVHGQVKPKAEAAAAIAAALRCEPGDLDAEAPPGPVGVGARTYTVLEAAALLGKSQDAVRVSLQQGRAPFGYAAQMPGGHWDYTSASPLSALPKRRGKTLRCTATRCSTRLSARWKSSEKLRKQGGALKNAKAA